MTELNETAKHIALLNQCITESLDLALSEYKPEFKSPHWDVFPKHYVESLRDPRNYECFRSNGLTYGLDDSCTKEVPRIDFLETFIDLIVSIGIDFLDKFSESNVGNPKYALVNGKSYNYNDLFLLL